MNPRKAEGMTHRTVAMSRRRRSWWPKDQTVRAARSDDGFMLLEAVVGLVIVSIVVASLMTVFGDTTRRTVHQAAAQAAARLLTQTADTLRSLPVDVLADRNGSETEVLIGGVSYSVRTDVEECIQPIASSDDVSCTTMPIAPSGVAYATGRRITISATWHEVSCAAEGCSRSDTIIVNVDRDPTFPLNDRPPPGPTLDGCLDQTVSVGQVVAANIRDETLGCKVSDGVSPFTWFADALPDGLSLDADGGISGTVLGPPQTITTTVTVTDAYLRTHTDAFTWTVVPPLTRFQVRDLWLRIGHDTQVRVDLGVFRNDSAADVTYEIVSGVLPAGLTLDPATGVISGIHQVTTAGDYPITIRASDPSGHAIDSSFHYYVRGNWPNRLLVCPTTPLPYDPPISVPSDPPACSIPGYYDAGLGIGADVATLKVNQPIPEFDIWSNTYGGTSPYRFETDGAPSWLHVDSATGTASGTPTSPTSGAPLTFRIQVYDAQDHFYAVITVRWKVVP